MDSWGTFLKKPRVAASSYLTGSAVPCVGWGRGYDCFSENTQAGKGVRWTPLCHLRLSGKELPSTKEIFDYTPGRKVDIQANNSDQLVPRPWGRSTMEVGGQRQKGYVENDPPRPLGPVTGNTGGLE